jgi:hypothetical protein
MQYSTLLVHSFLIQANTILIDSFIIPSMQRILCDDYHLFVNPIDTNLSATVEFLHHLKCAAFGRYVSYSYFRYLAMTSSCYISPKVFCESHSFLPQSRKKHNTCVSCGGRSERTTNHNQFKLQYVAKKEASLPHYRYTILPQPTITYHIAI